MWVRYTTPRHDTTLRFDVVVVTCANLRSGCAVCVAALRILCGMAALIIHEPEKNVPLHPVPIIEQKYHIEYDRPHKRVKSRMFQCELDIHSFREIHKTDLIDARFIDIDIKTFVAKIDICFLCTRCMIAQLHCARWLLIGMLTQRRHVEGDTDKSRVYCGRSFCVFSSDARSFTARHQRCTTINR